MEKQKSAIARYWKQYKWSNIFAMIKNNGANPEICGDDFKDRLMVITGGTSGIGYYTCRKYASHGARILSINRNGKSERCRRTQDFGVECSYMIANFSSLKIAGVGELSAMKGNNVLYTTRVFLSAGINRDGFETTLSSTISPSYKHLIKIA